ncbi:MAG: hypothetical protein GEV28_24785 [Actinophytocola sp.]|uniref:DUF6338 family protein n=1 Tax=Actinophytocola sp. TaxID=1872138 RepID=UPI0013299217|nr:DUF6338 family protein [Actinophytocola sp.]MPZ83432.1 hypothetical protein [Actinophytocola sp.]
MIPQTVAALLAFLALVAPGIFFEQRRERRRVAPTASVFREVSGIALASLSLTSVAILVSLIARAIFGDPVVDLRTWVTRGAEYFNRNFYMVVINVIAMVLLAFIIAWLADRVLLFRRKGTGKLSANSLWYQAFREDKPDDSIPWVHVELLDGSSFYGNLRGSTAGSGVDDREICLDGAYLARRKPPDKNGSHPTKVATIGGKWEYVIIRSSEIRYIKVQYLHKSTGEILQSPRRVGALARDAEGHEAKP